MNVQEFAARVGLSPHTVRYYEKLGLLIKVRRDANGHRRFSEQDIAWLEFILRLKNTGMSLADIHRYAQLRAAGDGTLSERKTMMEIHARQLHQQLILQQEHLARVQEKIVYYDNQINKKI
ncbi:MAG: MerR family transcriptional regulator [Undibacterium sp.]|uniref:MerR family transcriptional regulator n=1 Tax=Undibacterium sp. TaxID=1914977 RepID=UPI00271A4CE4|nr:MerR family transcriptional regulator [Undibacterium sp.]MDO8651909.1 MerR family transcriptional regulator [Undibacterium sp.]